jgi:hypothetical protein
MPFTRREMGPRGLEGHDGAPITGQQGHLRPSRLGSSETSLNHQAQPVQARRDLDYKPYPDCGISEVTEPRKRASITDWVHCGWGFCLLVVRTLK